MPDLIGKWVELLKQAVPALGLVALLFKPDSMPDALVVWSTPVFQLERQRHLAAEHRLPTVFHFRTYVEAGGLMSYGPNLPDLNRRAAAYASKILAGTKPANLPVEQPTKFESVIDRKTAKALGLAVPRSLLARADEVIE